MTVDPATAKHKADYKGTTYYFCCRRLPQPSSWPTRQKYLGKPREGRSR